MKQKNIIHLNWYKLILTCPAFPEQYDVYKNNKYIAYLRLRWGHFRIYIIENNEINWNEISFYSPKCHGEFLYSERKYYLKMAIQSIDSYLKGIIK
jgi:hypothetical protein